MHPVQSMKNLAPSPGNFKRPEFLNNYGKSNGSNKAECPEDKPTEFSSPQTNKF
jgi:hypothetical protein